MPSNPASDVKYIYRTEKAVRGLEDRTRTKMEAEGWELVSQTQGRLSTQMQFQKVKPKADRRRMAVLAGLIGLGVVLALVIAVMAILEKDDPKSAAPASSSAPSSPSAQPSTSSPTGSPMPTESPSGTSTSATETITASNNPEFANLLALTDQFDPSIEAFVTKYKGRTIEFEANVCAIGPHGSATTRFDILVCSGDYSETKSTGPNFQFRDVNVTSNLQLTNQKPSGTIGRGDNIKVLATIDRLETQSGLLLLKPVATSFR